MKCVFRAVITRDHVESSRTTMTSTPTFPTNRTVVYGWLDADRRTAQNQEAYRADRRTYRNAAMGAIDSYRVQLLSPFGSTLALRMWSHPGVVGNDFLHQAPAGALITVEGYLSLEQRFATSRTSIDSVPGNATRELTLHATSVRTRADDESISGSGVWLAGSVLEPPTFLRHPHHRQIFLGRTLLRVQVALADQQGIIPVLPRTCDIPVAVAADHADAELLYRQGNYLQIRGQIDRMLLPQAGSITRTKLADIDNAWQKVSDRYRDNPDELRRQEQIYNRRREQATRSLRTLVLAVSITGQDSALPLSADEARAARREYNKQQSQSRRKAQGTC